MRIRNVLLVISTGLLISACASHHSKNPQQITLYDSKNTPETSYRVIGTATVSRYNLIGMQRNDVTLQQMIKTLAAANGGDGIINIERETHQISGDIIAYQAVLF